VTGARDSRLLIPEAIFPSVLSHHPVHDEMVALLEFLDGSKRPGTELPDFIEPRLFAEIIEYVLEMSNRRSRRLAFAQDG
jgi:hypothetical protein